MFDLLLKDFGQIKWRLVFVALYMPLYIFMCYSDGNVRGLAILPLIALGVPVAGLFKSDEKLCSNVWYASFPYARRMLLKARYISVWFFVIAICLYAALAEFLVGFHQIHRIPIFDELVNAPLLPCFFVSLGINLYIPFIIRYGYKRGSWLLAAIIYVPLICLLIYIGVLSDGATMRGMLQTLSRFEEAHREACIMSAFIIITAGALLSFRLSARIFETKDIG
jgi:hypothetical protein